MLLTDEDEIRTKLPGSQQKWKPAHTPQHHQHVNFLFQMKDERNYHIFYCMLAGMNAEEKKQLEIKDATDYFYLIQVYSHRDEASQWHRKWKHKSSKQSSCCPVLTVQHFLCCRQLLTQGAKVTVWTKTPPKLHQKRGHVCAEALQWSQTTCNKTSAEERL